MGNGCNAIQNWFRSSWQCVFVTFVRAVHVRNIDIWTGKFVSMECCNILVNLQNVKVS
jgi:hypothetical protein